MPQFPVSILTAALLITLFALPVERAVAMSLFRHHDGGGSQPGVNETIGKSSVSNLQSIDAQPYLSPVPEPSTIILLGSGLAALGVWRWKKKSDAVSPEGGPSIGDWTLDSKRQ
jgi:PEP-CTERM motif